MRAPRLSPILLLVGLLGLPALLALLAPASALTATVDFALRDAPHCVLPGEVPWCPLGHDDNGTPTDPGDDTLHPSTAVDHLDVDVDPGIPGVPPVRLRFGNDEGFGHPVYRTLEELFRRADDALPAPLRDYFHYHDENHWFRVCVPEVLPPELLYPCRMLPLPIYLKDFIERDRIYPLPRLWDDSRHSTDDLFPILADLLGACTTELRHQTPGACRALNETAHDTSDLLQEVLPNVVYHEGVQDVDLDVGSEPSVGGEARSHAAEGEGLPGTDPPGVPGTPVRLAAWHPPPGPDVMPPGLQVPTRQSGEEARPLGAQEAQSWTIPGKDLPWLQGLAAAAGAGAALLAVALYRRIVGKRVLGHATRQAILQLAAERPGITIQEAARELDRDYKTIQHHVEVLLADHHLVAQRLGRMRKLFPNHGTTTEAQRRAWVALQRPGAQRMWRLLKEQGPMPRRELERRAGLGRTAAYECLRALQRHGWVHVTGTHGDAIVAPTRMPPTRRSRG